MNVKQIGILTDTNGDFVADAKVQGEIIAIALDIGDLSTPDVTVTDSKTSEAIFAKTGIASSDTWNPRKLATTGAGVDLAAAAGPPAIDNVYVPPVCLGTLHVVVAGAGSIKSGTLYVAFRG